MGFEIIKTKAYPNIASYPFLGLEFVVVAPVRALIGLSGDPNFSDPRNTRDLGSVEVPPIINTDHQCVTIQQS